MTDVKNKWNDYENPPESGTYIVAWVWKHEECPYPHFFKLDYWDAEDERWEHSCVQPVDVLAWMPLPEWYEDDDK